MTFGSYKIKVERSSNFPLPIIEQPVASRTRAQLHARNVPDVLVARDFLKKVVGIDRQYPDIVQVKRHVIKVDLSTVEIWVARFAAICALYATAREYI